jgi:hypothetical protein
LVELEFPRLDPPWLELELEVGTRVDEPELDDPAVDVLAVPEELEEVAKLDELEDELEELEDATEEVEVVVEVAVEVELVVELEVGTCTGTP